MLVSVFPLPVASSAIGHNLLVPNLAEGMCSNPHLWGETIASLTRSLPSVFLSGGRRTSATGISVSGDDSGSTTISSSILPWLQLLTVLLGKHPYLLPPRYHIQCVESLSLVLKTDLSDKPEVEVGDQDLCFPPNFAVSFFRINLFIRSHSHGH